MSQFTNESSISVVRRLTPYSVEISYNSENFNLFNADTSVQVLVSNKNFVCDRKLSGDYLVQLRYGDIHIITHNIHLPYVILQYIFNVDTIEKLSKLDWDYQIWKFDIQNKGSKRLSSMFTVAKFLLNLDCYDKPMTVDELEDACPLKDKRGWGGERPREVYYKLGFPFETCSTAVKLKPGQRTMRCPFPTERINPERKAIVVKDTENVACFTCGVRNGEKDKFGNVCKFEKGHLEPHIAGGCSTASYQCKWCNTFYKDKMTWDASSGKPTFNLYAIIRDAPKRELFRVMEQLGYEIRIRTT